MHSAVLCGQNKSLGQRFANLRRKQVGLCIDRRQGSLKNIGVDDKAAHIGADEIVLPYLDREHPASYEMRELIRRGDNSIVQTELESGFVGKDNVLLPDAANLPSLGKDG